MSALSSQMPVESAGPVPASTGSADTVPANTAPDGGRPASTRPDRPRPADPGDAGQLDLDALDAGQPDLEDRHALRRVAGLSTELQDVTEVEYRELRLERVVLMGVWTDGTLSAAENSLRELSRLAETAGSQVLDGLIQRRGRPD